VCSGLNPHGERSASAGLYWPGHDEDPRPSSPTAGKGFYDRDRPQVTESP
jgi:hypothetical protein